MSYGSKQSKPDSEQSQKTTSTSTTPTFSDQRASTATQLKQQNIMRAAHSPKVIQQMTAEEEPVQGEFESEAPVQLQAHPVAKPINTGLPIQLKTLAVHKTQQISNHTNTGSLEVGAFTQANLDVQNPVKGSAPGGSKPHDDLMTALGNQFAGAGFLRGHLLNDNLGGFGIWENMFPITKNANVHHLEGAERWVKQSVVDATDMDAKLNSKDKVENKLKTDKNPNFIHSYYARDPNDNLYYRNLNPIPDDIVPHHHVKYDVKVTPDTAGNFLNNPAATIKADWNTVNENETSKRYESLSPTGEHLKGSETIRSAPGVLSGLNEKLTAGKWGSEGSGARSGVSTVVQGANGLIPGLPGYQGVPLTVAGSVKAYKVTKEP